MATAREILEPLLGKVALAAAEERAYEYSDGSASYVALVPVPFYDGAVVPCCVLGVLLRHARDQGEFTPPFPFPSDFRREYEGAGDPQLAARAFAVLTDLMRANDKGRLQHPGDVTKFLDRRWEE